MGISKLHGCVDKKWGYSEEFERIKQINWRDLKMAEDEVIECPKQIPQKLIAIAGI